MVRISAAFRSVRSVAGGVADARGFIRDWLIGGAYPSYLVDGSPTGGFRDDPLAEKGGEANLRRTEGMRDTALFKADKSKLIAGIGSTNEWGFKEDKTFPVVWKTFTQKGESPVVTLDGRFGPHRRPHDRLCRLPHRVARGAEDPAPHRQRRRFQSLAERQTCRARPTPRRGSCRTISCMTPSSGAASTCWC